MRRRLFALALVAAALGGHTARADQGAVCQQLGAAEAAIAACTSILDDRGSDAASRSRALNNRGLALAAGGDHLRAIEDFDAALVLDPTLAAAHSNRGNSHAALGDMLKALADHDRAIDLDPEYVAAWHNRGVDHEELGNYRKALEDYRKTLTLAPDHRGSHIGLATASCKLGRIKASAEARLIAIRKGLIAPKDMQRLLQAEGFYRGPIDGLFGKGSRAALRAWTRKGCLSAA